MALSILLYDGTTAGSAVRYALKADSFSLNIAKTPLQTPIAQGGDPIIIDFGFLRPTITITGLVDTVSPSETVTGPTKDSSTTYTVPTKEQLEAYVTGKFYDQSALPMEVIISDGSTTPVAAYEGAISQARFDLAPSTEDRFSFTLVFLVKKNKN